MCVWANFSSFVFCLKLEITKFILVGLVDDFCHF